MFFMYVYKHVFHMCVFIIFFSIRSALHLSWPAENKAKRFSRSLTFVFSMNFSQNALIWTTELHHVPFCPANSIAKHFIYMCMCVYIQACFSYMCRKALYICVYVCVYISMFFIHVSKNVLFMYVYKHVFHVHVWIICFSHTCIYIYIYMYVYMYKHVFYTIV
jgi:hypothetical protein